MHGLADARPGAHDDQIGASGADPRGLAEGAQHRGAAELYVGHVEDGPQPGAVRLLQMTAQLLRPGVGAVRVQGAGHAQQQRALGGQALHDGGLDQQGAGAAGRGEKAFMTSPGQVG